MLSAQWRTAAARLWLSPTMSMRRVPMAVARPYTDARTGRTTVVRDPRGRANRYAVSTSLDSASSKSKSKSTELSDAESSHAESSQMSPGDE